MPFEPKDYDYVITEVSENNWVAYIRCQPDGYNGNGTNGVDAMRNLNLKLWHHQNDKDRTISKCQARMVYAVREAAGVPKFLRSAPGWALKKWEAERNAERARLDIIMHRVIKDNPKMSAVEITDLILEEFTNAGS